MQTENTHRKSLKQRVILVGGAFHSCAGYLGVLGGGYPLAALFPAVWMYVATMLLSLRGHRHGIFYRAFRRRPLGLRECFFWGCHEHLFEPTAAALAMDAHGAFDAAGFADCHGLPGLPICLSS